MAFNGTEGSPIDPNLAGAWTRTFRETASKGANGHFFGREILLQLLEQEGAMGIRFYYGIDRDEQRQLLAVAADAEQNDQLGEGRAVADDSAACPPWSSMPNILNS
jgi:hypothetical protein